MKINHYYGDLICILYITLAFQRILLERPSHGYAYKFRIDPIAWLLSFNPLIHVH